ncbi:hypothetical protein DFH06DRAFT_101659 [Mycena polygramma]|nr:hypothetical protein DFH06DRAFT_101659 [Mycena polygramma]
MLWTRECDGVTTILSMMEIQELVDLTIDFLHDSPEDLKRSSLVNRSWLPAARHHLFSYFPFESAQDCQRLATMLKEAPDLLGLVAHLVIAPAPRNAHLAYDLLAKCAEVHFTRLKHLTIYTLPPKAMMPLLHSMIALPSVTHLSVLQTEDPIFLASFLSRRTSSLGTLEIGSRSYRTEEGQEWYQDDDKHVHSKPFRLDCLRLPSVIVFDLPDDLPIDIAALKRLVIAECAELDAFEAVVRLFKSSLTELEIAGHIVERPDSESFRKKANIGLHTLPLLEHFCLHVDAPSTLAAVPILLSGITPGASLRRVTLVVSRDCAPFCAELAQFAHVDRWNAIDEAISSFESTCLTVRVSLAAAGVLESPVGVCEIRACLPRLASTRRLLVAATP